MKWSSNDQLLKAMKSYMKSFMKVLWIYDLYGFVQPAKFYKIVLCWLGNRYTFLLLAR